MDVKNLGNHQLLALAARTATPTPVEFPIDKRAIQARVVVVTTAAGTSPSTVFSIEAYDQASATWWEVIAVTAVTGAGDIQITVAPDGAAASTYHHPYPLPGRCRLKATHGNATSHTYSAMVELFG